MSRSNNPSPFFTTKIDQRMDNKVQHARSWNENIWLFSNLLIPSILVGIIWLPFHCPSEKLQQLLFLLQKSQTKYKNDMQRNLFDYFKEISTFLTPRHYSRACLTTFKSHLFQGVSKLMMALVIESCPFPHMSILTIDYKSIWVAMSIFNGTLIRIYVNLASLSFMETWCLLMHEIWSIFLDLWGKKEKFTTFDCNKCNVHLIKDVLMNSRGPTIINFSF